MQPPANRLQAAHERIDRDYARPLTVAELARVAECSPFQLIRSFQRAYGVTPGQCLKARRMERARELLTTTPAPVTEISTAVGYRSLGTFSRVFRQATGESPTGYRLRTRKSVYVPGCFVRMYRAELSPLSAISDKRGRRGLSTLRAALKGGLE